ncbi:hypothetical protein ACC699_37580, partial [Rhizobium ruizarguesonis]
VFAFLIGKSVVSGAGTALLAAFIGYPIAVSMTRLPVFWKGIGSIVLLTPLYTGEIVRIYAWRLIVPPAERLPAHHRTEEAWSRTRWQRRTGRQEG